MIYFQLGGISEGPLVSVVILGGFAALIAGILGRIWIERRQDPFQPSIETVQEAQKPDRDIDEDRSMSETQDNRDALIRKAEERYDEGDFQGTIQAAYMYSREILSQRHELDAGGTQWDFFERYVNVENSTNVDDFADLTEVYERAAFNSDSISRDDAERALEISQTFEEIQNGSS